jgi:hypothetical protein
MVNPAAFPLYVPAKDRLAPGIAAPIPSVCVQMMEGSDDLKDRIRTMKIRLCLATWNPGEHPGERVISVPNPDALGGYSYSIDPGQTYKRDSDGWMDLYNFQDIVLNALGEDSVIANVQVDRDTPVTYGPFTEDGAIWDYYPYWHGWVTFSVISGVPRQRPESYDDFL